MRQLSTGVQMTRIYEIEGYRTTFENAKKNYCIVLYVIKGSDRIKYETIQTSKQTNL